MSTLMSYSELEIGLHRYQEQSYHVELRFSNPASEAEIDPVRGETSIDPRARSSNFSFVRESTV